MKRTPEIFEKIEQYLANSLSAEELAAFEKEMTDDPELQTEVEKHRDLHQTLKDKDTLAFKEKLVKIHKEIKEEQKTTSASWLYAYWKIAASIIVLLSIGALLWHTLDSNHKTQDLYMAYYTPFPVVDVTRGEISNELQNIMKDYTHEAYAKVITALEKHPELINQEALRLYLGTSYMNTDQEQKAITQFEHIEKNSSYYEAATWYELLAYLKLGNTHKTIARLREIIEYNGIYKEKAIRLQEVLAE